ncbi:hypothetical protein [Amycolatopsis sp. lyj-112]|uniref:hypothetical protein n=1 Tax=Amycolatopsis sp. lyj-112 TaxID=2789288 RepID=UPI003978BBBF
MKVNDPEGRQWEIDRRFAPWRRRVQPFAVFAGGYRHYRLKPDLSFLDEAEPKSDEPPGKLATVLMVLLFLYGLPEIVMYVFMAILLIPVRLLEMLCQGLAGLVSQAVRRFRKAPSRVDVLGWQKEQNGLASLTILKVPDGLVAPLVAELGGLLRGRTAFDPGEPAVREVLTRMGARVERHRTLLRPKAPR